jgi:DNA replication protein DnaC
MSANNDVTTALRDIGIRLSPGALQQLLDDMTAQQLTPSDVCAGIAAAEMQERARRNHDRRLQTAALGTMNSIDKFDWQWPTIDKSLVDRLVKLDFVTANENVLLRGPSGLGKTMIAKNLGRFALQRGMHVRFSTIAAMLTDIVKQDGVIALERRMRRYTQPELLILDELGYVPHGAKGADHLFSVISQRHEVRSTIITTNLAYKKWGEVFDNAASIHAAVDRFAEHCHVVDIDGESYRQRKAPGRSKSTK